MAYGVLYGLKSARKKAKKRLCCNEPQKLNKKLLGFYYETFY